MPARLIVFFLFICETGTIHAQYSLTGTKGLINVPEAAVLDEKTFQFGIHTNTEEYLLIDYGDNRAPGDEYISSLTIGFLDRINFSLMLSRIFGEPKQTSGSVSSIGDRSFQVTALVLKETRWRPSLVLNLTDPFFSSNQFLAGNHVLVTKELLNLDIHQLKVTAGYGLPYALQFTGQERRELIEKQSDFLTGVFGGIKYHYRPFEISLSAEYDGRSMNVGLGKCLWSRLYLQAYLQDFRYPGIGFNYQGVVR